MNDAEDSARVARAVKQVMEEVVGGMTENEAEVA